MFSCIFTHMCDEFSVAVVCACVRVCASTFTFLFELKWVIFFSALLCCVDNFKIIFNIYFVNTHKIHVAKSLVVSCHVLWHHTLVYIHTLATCSTSTLTLCCMQHCVATFRWIFLFIYEVDMVSKLNTCAYPATCWYLQDGLVRIASQACIYYYHPQNICSLITICLRWERLNI